MRSQSSNSAGLSLIVPEYIVMANLNVIGSLVLVLVRKVFKESIVLYTKINEGGENIWSLFKDQKFLPLISNKYSHGKGTTF